MDISFPRVSAYDPERDGVSFPALVDGAHNRMIVSREALQDHFDAGDSSGNALVAVFERNRGAIERVATQLLEQGAEGDIVLSTRYF